MKLLIRADANSYIATGHVIRCISIAHIAVKWGHKVKFVVADYNGEALLKKYNMNYICLESTWNQMDNELDKLEIVIDREEPDCILVDSYYVTENYLKKLCSMCKIAYIDDLNKFVYPCDILICYANYYKKFEHEKWYSSDTKLLLGPKYAPLRTGFSDIKPEIREKNKKSVLVMSGGTDVYHFIADFLEEYIKDSKEMKNVKIKAICGIYNQDYDSLVNKYKEYQNIELLKTVDNIEKYMLETDIAISAGGSTLYELCACSTPTICYTFADNQIDNAQSFMNDGTMIYVGDIRQKGIIEEVVKNMKKLIFDDDIIDELKKRMAGIVDGHGAERIVETLLTSESKTQNKL